ncbi:hypothetical protein V1517DRAFT_145785 [Lipomyces orientalis]|uniref:Uncharacterized protein n=1 Tax=Lipomyces orientalis TaxID=1233043 RepID=A0ACC3TY88_9ASCO
MSDLEEDLLALAEGVEEDTYTSTGTSRKRNGTKRKPSTSKRRRKFRDESDDDDIHSAEEEDVDDRDEFDDESDDQVSKSRSSRGRGKRNGDDEEYANGNAEDENDLDETFINPYPLQGKYKNKEDMNWLETLGEFEREQILFERSQEMQRFNERKYLAQRLKESKRAGKEKTTAATRSSTRDTPKGALSKRSQLSELKKKREEKNFRARQRSEDHDYGGTKLRYDEDEEAEDEVEVEDEVTWADTVAPKDLTVDDVNKIRIGRTLLAKYCHYPEFDRCAVDCFVRINIGYNEYKQKEIYRVCQIKAVIESKTYTFMNRTVNSSLLVTHGSSEKIFEMGVCSDKPFTEEEFDTWKNAVSSDKLSLPSKRLVDSKFQQLQKMRERTLTPDEINAMIDLRQLLSSNLPTNAVIQKTMLNQKRLIAMNNGDMEEVAEIDSQIKAIDQRQTVKLSTTVLESPLQMLAKVNERNRRANQDEIRKAEIKATEVRRKAMLANKSQVTSDPFSRLKTNPRMYYDSAEEASGVVANPHNADEIEAEIEAEEEKKKLTEKLAKQPLSAVDDVIANTEFELDIDLGL